MSKSLIFAIIYFPITAALCVLTIVFVNWLENREIEKICNEARIEYTKVEYICTDIKTNTYQIYDGEITSETIYCFGPTDTETFDDRDYGFNHKNTTDFNTKEPFMLHTAYVVVDHKCYTRINSDNLPLEDFAASLISEIDKTASTYVNKSFEMVSIRIWLIIGCSMLFVLGICKFSNLNN